MAKKFKRTLSLIIAILILLGTPIESYASIGDSLRGIFSLDNSRNGPRQTGENFGPFTNVINTVNLDEGHEDHCQRTMSGNLTFNWPDSTKFYDIVVIQSLNRTFINEIDHFREDMETMFDNLNFGTDVDGVSPKDRVMIQTFKGVDTHVDLRGGDEENSEVEVRRFGKQPPYSLEYSPENSTLMTDSSQIQAYINEHYDISGVPLSSGKNKYARTATLSGMKDAQTNYLTAIGDGANYNQANYNIDTPNGSLPRSRETIYVLITDNPADAARWEDIPNAQEKFGIDLPNVEAFGAVSDPYKENHVYEYRRFTNYKVNQNLNTSEAYLNQYGWKRRYDDDPNFIHHPLTILLEGMGTIVEDMKTEGLGATKFIPAFYEGAQLATANGGYGEAWPVIKGDIKRAYAEIASKTDTYGISYNIMENNIDTFSTKIEEAIYDAVDGGSFANVTLGLSPEVIPTGDLTLYRESTDGSWEEVLAGNRTFQNEYQIIMDMTNLESGYYKLDYGLKENSYNRDDYNPVKLTMTLDGVTRDINFASPVSIEGNTKEDCDIAIRKEISDDDESFLGGITFQELDKQREAFNYTTIINFTDRVQDARQSLQIRDVVDSRLDIVDAWITPGNQLAEDDATEVTLDGESHKLIAELKNGTNDHGNVKAITQEGNTLIYNLPESESGSGTKPLFDDYEGKDYVLTVRAKVKDDLSDVDINAMHANDPVDDKKMGVPNVAEVLVDGNSIRSNRVKVLPPRTKSPTVSKHIRRKDVKENEWNTLEIPIQDREEEFIISIDVAFPEDTSGYSELVIEDDLIDELQYIGPTHTKIQYGQPNDYGVVEEGSEGSNSLVIGENGQPVDSGVRFSYVDKATGQDTETETNYRRLRITNREILKKLEGKTLSVQIGVQANLAGDLSHRFNTDRNAFVFPNTAWVRANELQIVRSNQVSAVLPMEKLEIIKLDRETDTPLAGAQFSIKDNRTEIVKSFTTNRQGKITIGKLEPHNRDNENNPPAYDYTIVESQAPEGYIRDQNNEWYVNVNKNGILTIEKKGETGTIEGNTITAYNTKPQVPEIGTNALKLKGEGEAEFSAPTTDDPYKTKKFDEEITYEIRVPIESVDGIYKLEFSNTFDPSFLVTRGSLQAFTAGPESGEVELTGNLTEDGRTITWTKESGFEIINDYIALRYKGKLDTNAWEALFSGDKNGIVTNQASLKVNNMESKDTNLVAFQVTRGRINLTKTLEGDGSGTIGIPRDKEARFTLYQKVPNGEPRAIRDIVLAGSEDSSTESTVLIDYLDPGSYFLRETSAPSGYTKVIEAIPSVDGITIEAEGGLLDAKAVTAHNLKSQNPTINKMVKGIDEEGYSSEDHDSGLDTQWQYVIDVFIPEGTTVQDYYVVDSIAKVLNIVDKTGDRPKVFLTNAQGQFEENTALQNELQVDTTDNANKIQFKIPSEKIEDCINKTIRIEFKIKTKNVNFLAEGVLDDQGRLPNTATLYHTDIGETNIVDTNTANVVPSILRTFSFKKLLGSDPVFPAIFKLYKHTENSETTPIDQLVPAKNPFTNGEYLAFSNGAGEVVFENVPNGKYWLVETYSPKGNLPYDRILVEVSNDPNLKEVDENGKVLTTDVDGAVIFTAPTGLFLTSAKDKSLWNNELMTFPVKKVWDDGGNQSLRPRGGVKVSLYRQEILPEGSGENPDSQKIDELILSQANNWEASFETQENAELSQKLFKYSYRTNNPYKYFVKEEDISLYNANYAFDEDTKTTTITNTLKEDNTLRLVKRDGDTADPIPGTKFVLHKPDGTREEAIADNRGLIEFTGLKSGVHYSFSEIRTNASKNYIVNTNEVNVFFDGDGQPHLSPNRYKLVTVNKGTAEAPDNVEAYELLNFKQPEPVKKVNGGSSYTLNDFANDLVFSIELPIGGTKDIKAIELTDCLDEALSFKPGSAKISIKNSEENIPIGNYFNIDVDSEANIITFETISSEVIDNLKNKTIIFEFKANVTAGLNRYAELHPDGKITNKAEVIYNNDEVHNKKETDLVTIQAEQSGSVTLQKKLQVSNGKTVNADLNNWATFDLYLKRGQWDDTSNRPVDDPTDLLIGSFRTDENGQIVIDKIGQGDFRFIETRAPRYFKLDQSPIEFTISDQGVKKLEFINKPSSLPTMNKMVKLEGGTLANRVDLKTWQDEMIYIVDIEIPENAQYDRFYFEDFQPIGLELVPESNIETKVGEGTGEDFQEQTLLTPAQMEKVKLKVVKNPNGRDRLYVDSDENLAIGESSVANIFTAMGGKTFRYIYRGQIENNFNDISNFDTDDQGYVLNTANLTINNLFTETSSAGIKPPTQYGAVVKKIADFKRSNGEDQSLRGAVFNIEQYKNDQETGPVVPQALDRNYVTEADGTAIIPTSLIAGKYILREVNTPRHFIDEEGNELTSNFTLFYDYYILETGVDLVDENQESYKGIRVTGVPRGGTEAEGQIVFEGLSNEDNPVKIVNRQRLTIPVEKHWEDELDLHGQRPRELTFLLQRAIVNGAVDDIGPDGQLVPKAGDEADTLDTAFNEAAKTNSDHIRTWVDGSGPLYFTSDDTFRFDREGNRLKYYILEVDPVTKEAKAPVGYRAQYNEVETTDKIDDGITNTVLIDNILQSPGELEIVKVDNGDPAQPIEGAKFNFSYTLKAPENSNQNDQVIIKTVTTDGEGKANLGSLAPNRVYTLEEIEAPDGYLKNPTVYTIEVGETEQGDQIFKFNNVPANEAEDVTVIPDPNQGPTVYSLKIVDEKLTTPKPVKTVNGGESYDLVSFDDILTYRISVPVESVEGLTEFKLTDTLNDFLVLQGGADYVTVTADGRDIKGEQRLAISEDRKTVSFTMTDDFDSIAHRNVELSFKAKVDPTATVSSIPNTAKLSFNGVENTSEPVNVLLGELGEGPSLVKEVNGKRLYNMKTNDEIVHYSIKSEIPANVLGYESIVITDSYDDALNVTSDIKVSALSYEGETEVSRERIAPDKYTLTHDPTQENKIKLELGDDFDFTTLAGKTLELSFDAQLDSTVDISEYEGLKVPNTASLSFNGGTAETKTVYIVPLTDFSLTKTVNGEEEISLTDNYEQALNYQLVLSIPHNVERVDGLTLTDHLSKALTLSPPSGSVANGTTTGEVQLTVDRENNKVTLQIPKEDLMNYAGKTITVNIPTHLSEDWKDHLVDESILNTAQLAIPNRPVVKASATVKLPLGSVTLIKQGNGEPLPQGITASFELYKGTVNAVESAQLIDSYTTAKNSEGQDIIYVPKLETGSYFFKEVVQPQGFVLDDTLHPFTIATDNLDPVITVDNLTETIEITATKKWVGGPTDKPEITLSLYRNGEKLEGQDRVLENGTNQTSWTVAKADTFGQDYRYEVKETEIPDNYVLTSIEGTMADGFIVTNTYKAKRTSHTVEKLWVGGSAPRPAITVDLYRQIGEDESTLTKVTDTPVAVVGTYTWTDLPATDDSGNVYNYSVKETTINGQRIVDGKTSEYTVMESTEDHKTTITNTYIGDTSLTINKVWKDNDNANNTRPDEITFKAIQSKDGQPTGKTFTATFDVKAENQYRITGLPKYADDYTTFAYTIDEVAVVGYSKEINQDTNTITNTLTDTISIDYEQIWQGGSDRPQVTIKLLANGEQAKDENNDPITATIPANASASEQSGRFDNLPKYDAQGHLIDYSMSMEPTELEGYRTTITGNETKGFTISHSFTVDKTTLSVTKEWRGGPESKPAIQVQLSRKIVGSSAKEEVGEPIELNTSNAWTYTWTDLDRQTRENKAYIYSVDEVNTPDGYSKTIEQSGNNFTIINSYIGDTSLSINKIWKDNGNSGNTRPNEITFKAIQHKDNIATGKVFKATFDVNSTNEYIMTGLPEYVDGETAFTYTIDEVDVGGYSKDIDQATKTITNTLARTTKIDYEQVWLGNGTKEVTTVNLLANGQPALDEDNVPITATISTDETGGQFENLPSYDDNGQKIKYTIRVNELDGFETSITGNLADGFTITRRALTNINVSKIWSNGNDSKPAVKVQLYRQVEGGPKAYVDLPIEVSSETEWKGSWANKPTHSPDNEAYIYTVEEQTIPAGYSAEVSQEGYNFTITNRDTIETTTIYGKKLWSGGPEVDHVAPSLVLYRNGQVVHKTPVITTAQGTSNEFSFEWQNVPKTDRYGQDYHYEVKEIEVPDNYILGETKGTGTQADPFVITNTYDQGKINYTVHKTWVGGPTPEPAIQVALYRQIEGGEKELVPLGDNANGTNPTAVVGSHTWTDLLAKDGEGRTYNYSVEETTIAGESVQNNQGANYTVSYEKGIGETTITNTYKSPEINLSGTKTWEGDSEAERPDSITVELYNGVDTAPVKTVTLNKTDFMGQNQWTYDFGSLSETDDQGIAYDYRVKEVEVQDGYKSDVHGMDLINTYIGDTSITINKVWKDNDNVSNTRPDEITFKAIQSKDGQPTGKKFTATFDVNPENQYRITGLPKYADDYTTFTYTIDEVAVVGYSKEINQDTNTITNTLTDTISIDYEQIWQGGSDRPQVTIKLLANGEQAKDLSGTDMVVTIPANASASEQSGRFDNLPKYDAQGNPIDYSMNIEPTEIEGYRTTITGNETKGFTISHSFTVDKTTLSVTKEWRGGPESKPAIQVQLSRKIAGSSAKEEVGEAIELNTSNAWTYTWTDLDRQTRDNKAYIYSVDEVNTPDGYSKTIEQSGNNFTIINSYEQGTTSIKLLKKWIGVTDPSTKTAQFNLIAKVDNVEVDLVDKDGNPISMPIAITGNGELKIDYLPRTKANGQVIDYSVEELPLTGFTSSSQQVVCEDCDQAIEFTNTNSATSNLDLKVEDREGNPLANSKFTLYKQDGVTPIQEGITTDESGLATIEGLAPNKNYVLRQTSATDGYNIDATRYNLSVNSYGKITVIGNSGPESIAPLTIVNEKIEAQTRDIRVQKTWIVNSGNVDDLRASFKLYKNGTATTKTLTINGNNSGVFSDLPYYDDENQVIHYTVEEEPAPTGYEVQKSGNANDGFVFVNIDNALYGTVVLKLDRATNKVLPGAVFELYHQTNDRGRSLDESTDLATSNFETQSQLVSHSSPSLNELDQAIEREMGQLTKAQEELAKIDNEVKLYKDIVEVLAQVQEDEQAQVLADLEKAKAGLNNETLEELTANKAVLESQLASLAEEMNQASETRLEEIQEQTTELEAQLDKVKEQIQVQRDLRNQVAELEVQLQERPDPKEELAKLKSDQRQALEALFRRLEELGVEGAEFDRLQREAEVDILALVNFIQSLAPEIKEDAQVEKLLEIFYNSSIEMKAIDLKPKEAQSEIDILNPFIQEGEAKLRSLDKTIGARQEAIDQLKAKKTQASQAMTQRSKADSLNSLQDSSYRTPSRELTWELQGQYTTDASGTISVGNLEAGKYKWVEKTAPIGYNLGTEEYVFELPDSEDETRPVVITAYNDPIESEKTAITVNKIWDVPDGTTLPEAIDIIVKRNGQNFGAYTIKASEGWQKTIGGLEKYDGNGNEYSYSVAETATPGYTAQVTSSANNFTITNIKTIIPPEPTNQYESIRGYVIWREDHQEDRPATLTVQLIDDEIGQVVEETTTSASKNWSYSFPNILVKDRNGKTYSYHIKRVDLPDYKTKVDGYNLIFNKIKGPNEPEGKAEYTTISGQKIWKNDNILLRPKSIGVQLVQQETGKVIAEVQTTANKDWFYSFGNVLVKDEKGKTYSYYVREVAVPGYTVSREGYNLINTKVESPIDPRPPVNPDTPVGPYPPVNPDKPDKPDTPVGPITPDDPSREEIDLSKLDKVIKYVNGYPDGSFRPTGEISRAEAAAMFARLLTENNIPDGIARFPDVDSKAWYDDPIAYLVEKGYMKGYPDGMFRPDDRITRAEFAEMIHLMTEANHEIAPFEDIKGHWAESAINRAYGNEILKGYPDGSFKPDQPITRVESVLIFNRLFHRVTREFDLTSLINKEDLITFTDVTKAHWAYYEILDAANTRYVDNAHEIESDWIKVEDQER